MQKMQDLYIFQNSLSYLAIFHINCLVSPLLLHFYDNFTRNDPTVLKNKTYVKIQFSFLSKYFQPKKVCLSILLN